jgi:hypothetical protein
MVWRLEDDHETTEDGKALLPPSCGGGVTRILGTLTG